MNKCALALGTFDGMHKGHVSVIKAARESGFDVIALTFSIPPKFIISGEKPELLMTAEAKERALAELEAEGLLVTRGTSGRFICPDPAVIEEAKRKILAEHAKGFLMKCRELGVDRNEAAQILLDIGKTNFSERTDTENE